MKLYYSSISQHSRRVISLLEEEGIKYEAIEVNMMEGEYLSEAYIAINPNHQVPTLVDGELVIHESHAIMRYLCRKYLLARWYPSDLASRARMDQWLDWVQCRQSPAVVDVVLNSVFMGDKGDTEAVLRGHEALIELNSILESHLAKSTFLAGEKMTLADLSLASNIYHLGLANAMPKGPATMAWYDKLASLIGYQKSLPEVAAA